MIAVGRKPAPNGSTDQGVHHVAGDMGGNEACAMDTRDLRFWPTALRNAHRRSA